LTLARANELREPGLPLEQRDSSQVHAIEPPEIKRNSTISPTLAAPMYSDDTYCCGATLGKRC
jgi:hypothetical protein